MPTSNIFIYLAAALFVIGMVWINADKSKTVKWALLILVVSALCLGAGIGFKLMEDFT